MIVDGRNATTSVQGMLATFMQSAAIKIKLYTVKVVMGNETNILADN